jgi:hypothetical protein
MKRHLCVWSILIILCSLASCGKAVSSDRGSTKIHSENTDSEEAHIGFVDDGQTPETAEENEMTIFPDKINVSFAQSTNLEGWQVAQTESFYAAFTGIDGYHLIITDAHGDAERQAGQVKALVEAPVEVLFIVPLDSEMLEDVLREAEESGIKVILLSPEETETMNGSEARRFLEEEKDDRTDSTDKKR